MHKIQKYFFVFRLSFIHTLKNYKSLIGLSVFLIACLVIFAHLWEIIVAKTGKEGLNSKNLLWYIAFNEWVLISIPDTQEGMEQDLRSGHLAYLLPRPISYLASTFAEAVGTFVANLIFLGGVTFLFAWLQTGMLPFHASGFLVAIFLGLMAGFVGIVFQMMIGLSAFWLTEVGPFYWIWEKLLYALGGLMLPLTMYPQWIQMVARFTPFPAILGDRSSLVFDFTLVHIGSIAGFLFGWLFLGLICLVLLYRKGLCILNIEGG